MRPMIPGDLDQAARTLLGLPRETWAAVAAELVERAQTADRFRENTGRVHLRFGDGSLMAAARLFAPGVSSRWCDEGYCAALMCVLTAVADDRAARAQRVAA